MSFSDHFSACAEGYARHRPTYPDALIDLVAGLVGPEAVVWDCASGNGQVATRLVSRVRTVVATDASLSQLRHLVAGPSLHRHVALAEESGLVSSSVDLITVAQALHWFRLEPFVAEVRRVLRPFGVLAIWGYGRFETRSGCDPILHRFHDETIGPFWPPERWRVVAGHDGLSLPFDEIDVPEFAIVRDWSLADLIGYVRTWSGHARFVAEVGRDPLPPLEEELRPLWGETRRVFWPISLRVVRRDG